MLFRPDSFEPLTDDPWDPERACAGIRGIVDEVDRAFDAEALWPTAEEWDAFRAHLPLTTLYAGAAGVVWALDELRRRGRAHTGIALESAARAALAAWREQPDFEERLEPPVQTHASLFFGETGILLSAFRAGADGDVSDALHERILANVENETNELLSGAPGTMLAARLMLDWTAEPRWAEAWRETAEAVWSRRDAEGLWFYPPFGRAPGASHGAATNTLLLLSGGDLFPAERREQLVRETGRALARYAVLEDGLANWPLAVEDHPKLEPWDGQIRLQWCHGGAGVVASGADWLEEDLLLAGAELVWRAGAPAMEKGPGICHGTAGNGYALLKVFGRTGDELWLERARRFAVHALGQVERWRRRRGVGRYSLWSGDLGAALFAADCLDARPRVPLLESTGE